MGSQFSERLRAERARQHVERPLARVKVLFDAFKRLCRDDFQNNAMFITRDQFQRVFDMDVEEAHRHFGYWDRATAQSRVVRGTVGRHGAVLRGTRGAQNQFLLLRAAGFR